LPKPPTSPFSPNLKKRLKQDPTLQILAKMHSLVNDSLTKINALMKKAEGKHEIVLLAQTANNLLKVQTKIEQLERYMEKTLLENSNDGNF
jgi:predicted exporter